MILRSRGLVPTSGGRVQPSTDELTCLSWQHCRSRPTTRPMSHQARNHLKSPPILGSGGTGGIGGIGGTHPCRPATSRQKEDRRMPIDWSIQCTAHVKTQTKGSMVE